MKVGIAGMSHLGVVGTVALATKGFDVVAFDTKLEVIEKLCNGAFEFYEPKLDEAYEKSKQHIKWSNNIQDLADSELVFVALDVESNELGSRDDSEVDVLVWMCLKTLKENSTLVINSQVLPGTTRRFIPFAKERNLHIFYQVETLILGEALNRALHPERIIVGAEMELEFNELSAIYQEYLNQFDAPIVIMDFESAELSKICINLFLVFSINFADTLSIVSKKFSANWNKIVEAMKLDSRIGKNSYLSPSLGLNGRNLIRDLRVVQQSLHEIHPYHGLIASIEAVSESRRNILLDRIRHLTSKFALTKVFFFGLAYKEETSSLANSPSFLAYKQVSSNLKVDFYDSLISQLPDGKRRIDFPNIELGDKVLVVISHKVPLHLRKQLLELALDGNEIYVLDPHQSLDSSIRCAVRYYESLFKIENRF